MKSKSQNLQPIDEQIGHEIKINNAIIRPADLAMKLGCSQSTLYRNVSKKLWTKPIKGINIAGWPVYEIEVLIAARIAGKTNAEIQTIVQQLEDTRKIAIKNYLEKVSASFCSVAATQPLR